MRFFVRKRKQMPAVIVVALIDVLIVLLIFLVFTTTFKQQHPALRLSLPESSQARKEGADDNPPFIVSIDPQGNLRLGADGAPVTVDQFKADLLNRVAKNPELKLSINGDKGAPWGQIVKVMDVAKEAKVAMVSALIKETGK